MKKTAQITATRRHAGLKPRWRRGGHAEIEAHPRAEDLRLVGSLDSDGHEFRENGRAVDSMLSAGGTRTAATIKR
jgi:hypothetical protein